MRPAEDPATGALLVRSAEALHRFGMPAHRLEEAIDIMARALGVEARVSATPTMLWIGLGPLEAQRVVMLRGSAGEVDLGRLVDLDLLMQHIAGGTLGPSAALDRLREILVAPPRWGSRARILAGGVTSAGGAVLFGGGGADVALAGMLGMLVLALDVAAVGRVALGRLVPSIAAFLVMMLARLSAFELPTVHPIVVGLSSLILMLPGLTFTLAVVELATANLVSGVARFAGAFVTLLRLILGVAIAQVLVPTAVGPVVSTTLPVLAVPIALLLSPLTAGIILQARPRDLPVIVAASSIGWAGAVSGAEAIGPLAGAGVGAFVLAVVSNLYARIAQRPAATPLVAGILLLVPGSFGFRSLAALLEGDVLVGVEQAFEMTMTGTALAAGMLLAASLLPPGRAL